MSLIYPILVLDLHQSCNQSCSYCVANAGPQHGFGRSGEIKKIVPFLEKQPQWNILLTGGEPLITPNLEEVLDTLLPFGQISLQTNLKTRVGEFTWCVPPEKTGWILATLHSSMLGKETKFLTHAKILREHGYPLVAKLILDDPMLPQFERLCDTFNKEEIPYILAPEVSFPDTNAKQYPPEIWNRIEPRITLKASRLYFKNGYSSYNQFCNAGTRMFYANLNNGKVAGCCHGYPQRMGNLYKGRLKMASGPIRCKLDRCMCDFHWYAGIAPVTGTREWEELLKGGKP